MSDLILTIIGWVLRPFIKNFNYGKNEAVEKTILLYSKKNVINKKSDDIFIKIRFWDAPFIELEKIIPKQGKIIDLGCGEGLFSNFLAICSPKRSILGIELDKNRINQADKGLKNTKFLYGDITKKEIPDSDVITLIHVLHHLKSKNEQVQLLQSCVKKLKKNGKLIIAEVNPSLSLKYFMAWFTDHYLVPWIFEKRFYSPIFFRSQSDWLDVLNQLDMKVKVSRPEQGKPFSHIVFECIKI